jgi:hypothetical protein
MDDTLSPSISEARAEGPAHIATLARRCLLRAWRIADSRDPGLDADQPFTHLVDGIRARPPVEPFERSTYSALTALPQQYPDPAYLSPSPHPAAPAEIESRIEIALLNIHEPPSLARSSAAPPHSAGPHLASGTDRAGNLILEAVRDLWHDGASAHDLQPIWDRLNFDDLDINYGHTVALLITTGEAPRALDLLHRAPLHELYGSLAWTAAANCLTVLSRPDEARQLLTELASRWDVIPGDQRDWVQNKLAESYGYLGDATKARDLVTTPYDALLVECVIAIGQHHRGETPDAARIIDALRPLTDYEPLDTSRAHRLTAVIELLLALGEVQPALDLLPELKSALFDLPLQDTFENHIRDAALVLAPYAHDHTAPIFSFAADILTDCEATSGESAGFWQAVHATVGLMPLIVTWASEHDVLNLESYIVQWRGINEHPDAES